MATLSGFQRTAGAAVAAAAALIAAGATLGASPAHAADSHTVTFSGGSVLNMLVCRSEPNPARLTVSAQSRVMFVNRLGQTATLRVDGRASATVGPNQAVPVVFHHGVSTVSMAFSCGAKVVEQFSAASITVVPAPRATAQGGVVSRGPGTPSTATTTGPSRPGSTRATNPAQDAPTAAGAEGEATATDPLDPAAIPAAPSGGASPPTGANNSVEQPVLAAGPAGEGASGLLALLAAVCAIGVTLAASRAIIAKRTISAGLA